MAVGTSVRTELMPATTEQQQPQQPQPPQKKVVKKIHYPFWFGGSASCFAAAVTHPLDLGMFSFWSFFEVTATNTDYSKGEARMHPSRECTQSNGDVIKGPITNPRSQCAKINAGHIRPRC